MNTALVNNVSYFALKGLVQLKYIYKDVIKGAIECASKKQLRITLTEEEYLAVNDKICTILQNHFA